MKTKKLLGLGSWVLGLGLLTLSVFGQGTPIATTAFTRTMLRGADSAAVRTSLGFLSTNNTVITNYVGNGASITNLNADELRSGTVPLARLSGITATQIADSTITTNKVDATAYAAFVGGGDVTQSGLAAGSYAVYSATNTIFVAKNGSDSTGNGSFFKPYASLTNAQAQAVAGQMVEVFPGNYITQDLLGKNGVNWYFHDGATVTNLVSEIFGDSGSAITNTIDGLGSFYGLWGGVGSATLGVLKQSNPSSRVIFSAKYAFVTNASTATFRIASGFARITVRDRIWSLMYDGVWATGPCDVVVDCPEIYGAQSDLGGTSSGSNSLEFGGSVGNICYFSVRSRILKSYGPPINATGGTVGSISADEIVGISRIAVSLGNSGTTNGNLWIGAVFISGSVYPVDQIFTGSEKWCISGARINSSAFTGPTIDSDIDAFLTGGTLENCKIITKSSETYSISDGSAPGTPTLVNVSGSLEINKATLGVRLANRLDSTLNVSANSDDNKPFLLLSDYSEFGSGNVVLAVSNISSGISFSVTDEGNVAVGTVAAGTITASQVNIAGGNVSFNASGILSKSAAITNFATFSTVTAASIAATGWTNVWSTNNATVYVERGASVAVTLKNKDNTTLNTFTAGTNPLSISLQPGWGFSASGNLSGNAVPF